MRLTAGLLIASLLSACAMLRPAADEELPNLPASANVDIPILDVGAPTTDSASLPQGKSQPYRFADVIKVEVTPESHGVWSAWDERLRRWRLEIRASQARSINLHFGKFHLPPATKLTVFNPDIPGAMAEFTAANNKQHGQLWTPQFEGDHVLLDLIVPPEAIDALKLELSTVNAAFR